MIRHTFVLLAGAVIFASGAPASGLPACSLFSGYTLSDMVGQGCTSGDKYFYNFESTSPDSLLETITFSPLSPIANDPGIQFNGLEASAGQTVSFNFTYTVEVSPGYSFAIRTPELSLSNVAFGTGGSLSGSAGYCEKGQGNAETCAAGGGTLYFLPISAGPPSDSFSSSLNIPTVLSLDVGLDLTVNGGQSGTSAGAVSQRFAQVATPEPAAFVLLGSGLLLLARLRPRTRGSGQAPRGD